MRTPIIETLVGLLMLQSASPAFAQNYSVVNPMIGRSGNPVQSAKSIQRVDPNSSLINLRQLALNLVNRDRKQKGLSDLVHNPLLDQVAQAHAEDMIRQNYFSHYSKDGRTPMQRVQATGSTMQAGENILSYQLGTYKPSRPELISEFQSLFYNSASHRKIMMRSQYAHFGYGFATTAQGRIVAVQLFGTP
ncbi:MAG: CAP domain-containing protein [Acaryochloridaceae cyanobacterium RL_2_7]|nr:CAP domain-containing protein [Acaryochloridaceae cyanobacterium RL_2_7]